MTIAGELINILGFKLEGTDALRQFNTGIDNAEKKSRSVADGMKIVGRAALGVGVAAAGFAAVAFRDAADFERVMNRIGITAGAGRDEVIAASDSVRRLAQEMALPVEDAVVALDTLVSSGQSLEEAMAFLPSVLMTAQASGAATTDIANTALKAASALKIEATELQTAFDIMVAGGKAGQFELKDMAQYIPELSNSFASLGYEGNEGLRTLIALLQTVREDTGSASGAATQLGNVFGKIYAGETANAFQKMGVDLRREMEAARNAGEDTVAAFVRISREAIDGDLSKLPLLFTDQEFRLGMQSLITSGESYQNFVDVVNSNDVDGSTLSDFNVIANDSASSIQRMSNAYDSFVNTVGAAVAPSITSALDSLTNGISEMQAVDRALDARGEGWLAKNFKPRTQEEIDLLAREGGFVPTGDLSAQEASRRFPEAYVEHGGDLMRPMIPEGPRIAVPVDHNTTGIMPTPEDVTRQQYGDRRRETLAAAIQGPLAMPPIEIVPPTEPVPAMIVDAPPAWYDPRGWFGGGDDAAGSTLTVTDNGAAAMAEVAAKVDTANARLQDMTTTTPATVDAVVTDARQDNRQFPLSTTVNVGGVNVTQAVQAPAAVGQSVGNAAAGAVAQQNARIEMGPAL